MKKGWDWASAVCSEVGALHVLNEANQDQAARLSPL